MITRQVDVDVVLTPEELAVEFADMSSDRQAAFFNELGKITMKWCKPFCFQLQFIADSTALTDAGRRVMQQIGEYGRGDT